MVIRSTRLLRILTLGSPWVTAIALFPFIIVRDGIADEETLKMVLNHERIHLRQQTELLVLPFYLWYGIEYLAGRFRGRGHYGAYREISFEKEAEGNMGNPRYLGTRRAFAFLKYRKSGSSDGKAA